MPRKRLIQIDKNVNNSLFATYWGEVYYMNFNCFKRYREIYRHTD